MDDRDNVYSKAVRAGKRTYFFDVRSTRGGDLFLNITESRKYTEADGGFHFEKHRIYLYKEDFGKFLEGLKDAIGEVERHRLTGIPPQGNGQAAPHDVDGQETWPPFTNLDFEDLDRKDI